MKIVNQIINDTLKNKKGEWVKENLQMFASFIIAVLIGFWIVISNYITDVQVSRYAIDVFYAFLLTSVGANIAGIYKKIKNKKIDNEINEQ